MIVIPKGQRVGTGQLTLIPKDNEFLDSARAIGLRVTSPSGHQDEVYIDILDDEASLYADILEAADHSKMYDEYLEMDKEALI